MSLMTTVRTEQAIVRVEHLSKTFPGTRALIDVGIDICAGEVHALVGHNGSGKSTLIKLLSGYHRPDPGAEAWLDGQPIDFDGMAHGHEDSHDRIRFVHQDLGLVPELDAVDNLAIHGAYRRTRSGRVKWSEQRAMTIEALAPFGLDIDIEVPVSKLTPVERTVVAIAAALQGWDSSNGVLVLDEPTAVLPPFEVERLYQIVKRVRAQGAGVLYVSHRLDEIFNLADRVTILRGGCRVDTRDVAGLSKQELVELMLGPAAESTYRVPATAASSQDKALEVRNLSGLYVADVTFEVARGEVVGIAGLPADGRDELPRLLTDRRRIAGGQLRLPSSGDDWTAVSKHQGDDLVLLPPDRGREGIIGPMSVAENLSLSVLGRFGSALRLHRGDEQHFVEDWIAALDIRTAGPNAPITSLSGGNQQKVLFGRSLGRRPQVLIMCEPTAGVDIGARLAIYDLIAVQATKGLSVIVTSSDIDDLLATCTRVLVLREGVVATELSGDELTEQQLVHAMEGIECLPQS